MKRLLLLAVAMTACLAAWGEEYLKVLHTLSAGDVRVECPAPSGWNIDASVSAAEGIEYVTVTLSSSTPLAPPCFTLSFSLPQKGIHHLWEVNGTARFGIKPDWAAGSRTNLSCGMPLYQFFGDNDDNALTVACDEVFRDVVSKMALREEGCRIVGSMKFFTVSEAPLTSYSVRVRLDARKTFWAASPWTRNSGCSA